MPERIPVFPVCLAALLLGGCAPTPTSSSPSVSTPSASQEGDRILHAITETTERVTAAVEPSLVFVEVVVEGGEGHAGGGRRRPGGQPAPQGPQQVGLAGLMLQADGTVLIPVAIPKQKVQDLKVWVGGQEYPAEIQKTDDQLQVTLLKIQAPKAAPAFVPARPSDAAFPRRGECLVVLTASGKDTDFQVFPGMGTVRGKVTGMLDTLIMDSSALGMGSVLAGLDGRVVGIARQNQVLFFPELLKKLDLGRKTPELADNGGTEDADDEEEGTGPGKGKPWLGLILAAVNEEYAEAEGLPKESIRVSKVLKDSPAAKAGLKPMDLLVGVNHQAFTRSGTKAMEQFGKFNTPEVGKEVTFDVLRDGQRLPLSCRYDKAPAPEDFQADDLGIQVRGLTEMLFQTTAGVYEREGVLVTSVLPGSVAGRAIAPGDVLVALDGKPTPDMKAFTSALESLRKRKAEGVLVKLSRGNHTVFAALNLTLRLSGKGDKS